MVLLHSSVTFPCCLGALSAPRCAIVACLHAGLCFALSYGLTYLSWLCPRTEVCLSSGFSLASSPPSGPRCRKAAVSAMRAACSSCGGCPYPAGSVIRCSSVLFAASGSVSALCMVWKVCCKCQLYSASVAAISNRLPWYTASLLCWSSSPWHPANRCQSRSHCSACLLAQLSCEYGALQWPHKPASPSVLRSSSKCPQHAAKIGAVWCDPAVCKAHRVACMLSGLSCARMCLYGSVLAAC